MITFVTQFRPPGLYLFSLLFRLWISSYSDLFDIARNFLLQNLHPKGFSPVWTLSWSFKPCPSLNFFMQNLQWYGFSPVWILSCILSESFDLIVFPQVWQQNAIWHICWLSAVCGRRMDWRSFSHRLRGDRQRRVSLRGCCKED